MDEWVDKQMVGQADTRINLDIVYVFYYDIHCSRGLFNDVFWVIVKITMKSGNTGFAFQLFGQSLDFSSAM